MKNTASDKPAIAGGAAAKQTPWGISENRYGEEELQELKEALAQGTLFYAQGKKVKELESAFAAKYGAKAAVACSSGTAAIHTAMIAVGISPGDEVIVTPLTDMGSLIPILFQGAVPVFADLHPNTYLITPETVEAVITPKTRAVLAVHYFGNACDMNGLNELCGQHNLALIEDCAQAFGCTYYGKPIGTLGTIGCFSFNEYKHISCGDGGICVTDDPDLARRLRMAGDKCYIREQDTRLRAASFLASNYRMTELQGAVALAQLRKLDDIVERRNKWVGGFNAALQDLEGISLNQVPPGSYPTWWHYMMRVKPELGVDASTFAEALRAEGLSFWANYMGKCVYEYPIFTDHSAFQRGYHPYMEYKYQKGMCPVAEEIIATNISMGVHESLTQTDLEEVVLGVRKVHDWYMKK